MAITLSVVSFFVPLDDFVPPFGDTVSFQQSVNTLTDKLKAIEKQQQEEENINPTIIPQLFLEMEEEIARLQREIQTALSNRTLIELKMEEEKKKIEMEKKEILKTLNLLQSENSHLKQSQIERNSIQQELLQLNAEKEKFNQEKMFVLKEREKIIAEKEELEAKKQSFSEEVNLIKQQKDELNEAIQQLKKERSIVEEKNKIIEEFLKDQKEEAERKKKEQKLPEDFFGRTMVFMGNILQNSFLLFISLFTMIVFGIFQTKNPPNEQISSNEEEISVKSRTNLKEDIDEGFVVPDFKSESEEHENFSSKSQISSLSRESSFQSKADLQIKEEDSTEWLVLMQKNEETFAQNEVEEKNIPVPLSMSNSTSLDGEDFQTEQTLRSSLSKIQNSPPKKIGFETMIKRQSAKLNKVGAPTIRRKEKIEKIHNSSPFDELFDDSLLHRRDKMKPIEEEVVDEENNEEWKDENNTEKA